MNLLIFYMNLALIFAFSQCKNLKNSIERLTDDVDSPLYDIS